MSGTTAAVKNEYTAMQGIDALMMGVPLLGALSNSFGAGSISGQHPFRYFVFKALEIVHEGDTVAGENVFGKVVAKGGRQTAHGFGTAGVKDWCYNREIQGGRQECDWKQYWIGEKAKSQFEDKAALFNLMVVPVCSFRPKPYLILPFHLILTPCRPISSHSR